MIFEVDRIDSSNQLPEQFKTMKLIDTLGEAQLSNITYPGSPQQQCDYGVNKLVLSVPQSPQLDKMWGWGCLHKLSTRATF